MSHYTRRTLIKSGICLCASGMASGAWAGGTERVSTGGTGMAIQGYDAHGYWQSGTARTGSASFTVNWKGVPWHFASQTDADAFAAEPERYAPQFGGFCTRAMSFKKVVDGDPTVWRIYGEGLYLFARPVGGKKFDGNEVEMIAKARAFWDTLE